MFRRLTGRSLFFLLKELQNKRYVVRFMFVFCLSFLFCFVLFLLRCDFYQVGRLIVDIVIGGMFKLKSFKSSLKLLSYLFMKWKRIIGVQTNCRKTSESKEFFSLSPHWASYICLFVCLLACFLFVFFFLLLLLLFTLLFSLLQFCFLSFFSVWTALGPLFF